MYSSDTMLDRFADGSLQTASGPKIVVMCFDRLDRDLTTALAALEQGDFYETNCSLCHAQDLLAEMAGMLDLDIWEHAAALLSVYDYLLRRLAQANSSKNAGYVLEVMRLVTDLGDAFRDAAVDVTVTEPDAAVGESSADAADRPRLSVQA
jgi:flagellar secretion chaperone FliS